MKEVSPSTVAEGIIVVSQTCSSEFYDYIESQSGNLLPSQQRLFLSLIQGLSKHRNVLCLTAPPIGKLNKKRRFWPSKSDTDGNANFHYLSLLNWRVFKQISTIVSAFGYLIKNRKTIKDQYGFVIFDPLISYLTIPCKWLFAKWGLVSIALITDIPSQALLLHARRRIGFIRETYHSFSDRSLRSYDGYILLTKEMGEVVNPLMRPQIVIEGVLDNNIYIQARSEESIGHVDKSKVVLYAGGINQSFGLFLLVAAFKKVHFGEWRLHIYGSGADEEQLKQEIADCASIQYGGMISSSTVFSAERSASILVNPRPTKEAYTKYSFPSKTLEYLASGALTLSTRLPGIPSDYDPYILWINDDSTEGIMSALEVAMEMPEEERKSFGEKAKEFVLARKNQNVQATKVLEFFRGFHQCKS